MINFYSFVNLLKKFKRLFENNNFIIINCLIFNYPN